MQWYEVKRFRAIPAANTTVVTTQTYGLFRLCQRAQGVTTCDRYDKLSKEDNIPREVHDGVRMTPRARRMQRAPAAPGADRRFG